MASVSFPVTAGTAGNVHNTVSIISTPFLRWGNGVESGLAHSCEEAGVLAGKLIVLNHGSGLSGWLSGERVPCPSVTGWP